MALAIERELTWTELDELTPIALDQHIFDVGQTGSGKSTIMKLKILSQLLDLERLKIPVSNYRMIIVDTKDTPHGVDWRQGNFDFPDATRIHSWKDFDISTIKTRLIIYRPDLNSDEMNPGHFREVFQDIRNLRLVMPGQKANEAGLLPLRVFIDELSDVVGTETTRNAYIDTMSELLVQGRSTWQTFWMSTQNPIYLDANVRRQTQVKFVFYLDSPDDRDFIAKQLGDKTIRKPIPDLHGFFYANRQIESLRGGTIYFSGKIKNAAQGR